MSPFFKAAISYWSNLTVDASRPRALIVRLNQSAACGEREPWQDIIFATEASEVAEFMDAHSASVPAYSGRFEAMLPSGFGFPGYEPDP